MIACFRILRLWLNIEKGQSPHQPNHAEGCAMDCFVSLEWQVLPAVSIAMFNSNVVIKDGYGRKCFRPYSNSNDFLNQRYHNWQNSCTTPLGTWPIQECLRESIAYQSPFAAFLICHQLRQQESPWMNIG